MVVGVVVFPSSLHFIASARVYGTAGLIEFEISPDTLSVIKKKKKNYRLILSKRL